MKNIFFAKFESNQRSCEVYGLWQYDYGQILRIQDLRLPTAVEIHFSLTEKGGSSITRVGTTKDGVTDVVIPDSLLENDDASQDYWIYAYIYLTDETSGSTEYKIAMKVKSRPRPEAIDRPEDQELFREAIAAVNEAAERAENAVNNLNADVSEKVTRPDTAEVGQALVVKEIDEQGKPTTFEAQDMVEVPEWAQKPEKPTYTAKEVGALPDDTKIPTKVSELENDSGYLTNPYDDTELKSEIATKITAPANPEVGKVFKIKSVNEDGTFIGEWADGGVANLDVQINGESIVKDGVAEIPVANRENVFGVVKTIPYEFWGTGVGVGGKDNQLRLYPASEKNIDARQKINVSPISVNNLDYAVKAAMCDGKGAAWTAEEQAAARERMGAWSGDWQIIMDETLAEQTQEISFKVPDDTKEMICFFKSGAALANTTAYLHTKNIGASSAESFAPFGGSLVSNAISIGCQKIQFINSKYGLIEYSYLAHSDQYTTDDIFRRGKISVLRIDNKCFSFHSTEQKTGYPAGTRLLVLVRR